MQQRLVTIGLQTGRPLMLSEMNTAVTKGSSLAFASPTILFASVTLASLSRSPDPHLPWLNSHFARGESGEIVCGPFSMFSIRGAERYMETAK